MPNAIITKSTLTSGFNQLQLATALKIALNNCGFTSGNPIAEGTSAGNYTVAYSHTFNANTKGTAFFDFFVNSTVTAVVFRVFDNYNTTTFTGTSSGLSQIAINANNSYEFYSVNHPEVRGVSILTVGSSVSNLGVLVRPNIIPSWWNENNFLYAVVGSFENNRLQLCGPNPFQSSTFSTGLVINTLGGNGLGTTNGNNTADLILAPLLIANNRGVIGQFSNDFAVGRNIDLVGATLTPGDRFIVSPGVQEYQVLNNLGNSTVAIRVV